MKKGNMKGLKQTHTANTQIGMGDSYGSAIKNPVATMRRDYLNGVYGSSKKSQKPPKALA